MTRARQFSRFVAAFLNRNDPRNLSQKDSKEIVLPFFELTLYLLAQPFLHLCFFNV